MFVVPNPDYSIVWGWRVLKQQIDKVAYDKLPRYMRHPTLLWRNSFNQKIGQSLSMDFRRETNHTNLTYIHVITGNGLPKEQRFIFLRRYHPGNNGEWDCSCQLPFPEITYSNLVPRRNRASQPGPSNKQDQSQA